MSDRDFFKPPPWEGNEKTFERIVGYIEDLTGFEGSITKEDLLVEDVGLDSLIFLELFFKLQTFIRRELSNKQLNRLLTAEVERDQYYDPDHQGISLYSRLRVRHLIGLVRRQLSHPMDFEEFDYSIWKVRFFPPIQSAYPAENSWANWISEFTKNESQFRNYKSQLEMLEIETLETLWLEDELGYQVLEDNLRVEEQQLQDLEALEKVFEAYLKNSNRIKDIRIQLVKVCLLRAIDITKVNDFEGDEWSWIVENYVDKQLNSENFIEWIDLDFLGVKLNVEEDLRLSKILRTYMVDFIRSKIDMILMSPDKQSELVEDFIQEEYDSAEVGLFSTGNFQQSQARIVDWYFNNNKRTLINEFRESYQESLLSEINLVLDLEPYSNNQQKFMDSYNQFFQKTIPTKFSELSSVNDFSIDDFDQKIDDIEAKWSHRINYLARLPRCGNYHDRLLILLLPDFKWKKLVRDLTNKSKNELISIYIHSSKLMTTSNLMVLEDLYLQAILEWSVIQECITETTFTEDLKQIEESWIGIEINIGGTLFSALEILLRYGVHVFSDWSDERLHELFSKPTDQGLLEVINSSEIQSLGS